MAKVSIIVPIYNMEKYLSKCLDSLISQTYKDIEILAISDGSTDKSVSIIKRYQKKDKRVKLIEKENGGYGSVLGYAINKLIKTKYFLICDPDDYLDKSCIETLYKTAIKTKVDLVYGSFYYVYKDGRKEYTDGTWLPTLFRPTSNKVFKNEEKNKYLIMVPTPHAKLYKTELAKDITFPHHISYTDGILYTIYLSKANSIIHLDKPLAYYLLEREGNTVTDTNPRIADYHNAVFNSAWNQYNRDINNQSNMFYYMMFLYAHYILKEIGKLNNKEDFLAKKEIVYTLFKLCQTKANKIKKAMRSNPLGWGIKRYIVNRLLLNRLTMKTMYNYLSNRIFSSYNAKTNEIKVSICLLTYNHKKYIKKAIDSILNQKTNFKYEIIIRDDASSDGTTDIIKKYHKKYPETIKLVLNKENKHNGKSRIFKELKDYWNGKYIAILEGDDYWIDPYKLQKQYDFMENNPDYSQVFTNYKVLNDITKKTKRVLRKSKDYSVEDIIIGDGEMFSISSIFVREDMLYPIDNFYYLSPFEDYVSVLSLALHGKTHFLKDYTTIYRINAENSWTTMLKTGDESKKRKYLYDEMKKMLEEFNKNTNDKYKKYTEYLLLKKKFIICVLDNNIKMMKHKKFKNLYKIGNFKTRFLYFNKMHFSKIYIYLRNIKHKVEKY